MSDFPCKDCIVKGICSKPCSNRKFKVSPFMLRKQVCIDCECTEYYESIHGSLYYMVCINCLSVYFISDNKYKGTVLRSQTDKSTDRHINENNGELHPKRSFDECYNRWKEWHRLKWGSDMEDLK